MAGAAIHPVTAAWLAAIDELIVPCGAVRTAWISACLTNRHKKNLFSFSHASAWFPVAEKIFV